MADQLHSRVLRVTPEPADEAPSLATRTAALADDLAATAARRDQAGLKPTAEIERLRAAGLLSATAPVPWGGHGASWREAMRLVRRVAQGDANIGQLLGYHYLLTKTVLLRGTPRQAEAYTRQSVAAGWYWGGAVNPRDADIALQADGDGFRLSGKHTFATGASLADALIVRALLDGRWVQFVVPNGRPGIEHGDDWDNFGQRLTESGSIAFRNVRVERDDILGGYPLPPEETPAPAQTLLTPMMQLVFVNFYLGAAQGALAEATDYVRTTAKPWNTAGVSRASEDPYVLELHGHLTADLRASLALADQALLAIDEAAARGAALTQAERTDAAALAYAAKVHATKTALDVANRIFELTGARATASRYGLDRYWRNIRVHTVHDPVAYKAREVGNHALNGVITSDPLYT